MPYTVWRLAAGAPVNVGDTETTNRGLGNAQMLLPTFSPLGNRLAFITGDATGGFGRRRGLATFNVAYNVATPGTPPTFSGRRNVIGVTSGTIKWPAFESDSQSVVFVQTPNDDFCLEPFCKTGKGKYGDVAPSNNGRTIGRLRSVDVTAATPVNVDLTRANTGERPADLDKAFQPTVLPVAVGGYRWMIFTSTRPYGNVLNPPGEDVSCTMGQFWVSALDDAPSGSTDRSYPAFWLPNQNAAPITSATNYTNEHAYWVLNQCRNPGSTAASLCETDADCCPGSVCRVDLPVSVPPVRHCRTAPSACVPSGGACASTAECCPGAVCANAQCVLPTSYATSSFSRDFESNCGFGKSTRWRFFDWQTNTPADTSIVFTARSADTVALLGAATSVPIGTAKAPPVQTVTWTSGPLTVDQALVGAGARSRKYLRVTMNFNPSTDGTQTPRLQQWRQNFDCVDSE
jgi:hypothetical protein